jgi:hypothetical protein
VESKNRNSKNSHRYITRRLITMATKAQRAQPRKGRGVPGAGEYQGTNKTAVTTAPDPEPKTKTFGTRDDTKEIMADLKKAVSSISTSEDWQKALEVFAGLHQYSFLNTVWLYKQNDGVTAVASYKKWEEKGIHVNKGQKALRVLAPVLVDEKFDSKGNAIPPDENGKYKKKVVSFKTVPVFDISQTDGFGKLDTMAGRWTKEMEKAGIAPEGMTDTLVEKATSLGFTVSYRDDLPGTRQGVTRFDSNEIVVNANLSDLRRAQVLSHEIGHIMMGHGDDHKHYHTGEGGERDRMEVEAESVAYVISRGWGINDNTQSSEYVAGWIAKKGADTDDLFTGVTNKLTQMRHDLPFPKE